MPRKAQTKTSAAAELIPLHPTLAQLRDEAKDCKACDLWLRGTQTVFGEGALRAKVMFVGEQPGDKEDLEGKPFVGPAGALLDKALMEAGIDRKQTYVTNAVKHFKWEPRGKLRIHKKPSMKEIKACRPWLDAELETVRPKLIVALGATAAQGLLGSSFRITQSHGKVHEMSGLPPIIATLHPSAILRALTDEDRHAQMRMLVEDLREAARVARD